jgi:hypothetical protein
VVNASGGQRVLPFGIPEWFQLVGILTYDKIAATGNCAEISQWARHNVKASWQGGAMKTILLTIVCLFVLPGSLLAGKILDEVTNDNDIYSKEYYKSSPKIDLHSGSKMPKETNMNGSQSGAAGNSFSNAIQQKDFNSGFGDYRNGSRAN